MNIDDDKDKGAFTMFGMYRVDDDSPIARSFEEMFGGGFVVGEDGFRMTFDVDPSKGSLVARWNEKTNEMTLEREDGAIILATRNPDAFHAGVELLRGERMVTWLGFALVRRVPSIPIVIRQEP